MATMERDIKTRQTRSNTATFEVPAQLWLLYEAHADANASQSVEQIR